MELDELKNTWTQYNADLQKNLKLNEEILREIKLRKIRNEMQAPIRNEYINLTLSFLAFLLFIHITFSYPYDSKFFVIGILQLFYTLLLTGIYIAKLILFKNLDNLQSPVIVLQKKILKIEKKYIEFKKMELVIILLLTFPLTLLVFDYFKQIDLTMHPKLFITYIIIALVTGYSVSIWLNKNIYEKRIENTSRLIEELKRFEK